MKKHIRFILTVCLTLCMIFGLGATAACDTTTAGDDKNTFTIIVKHEDGTPYQGIKVSACKGEETCIPGTTDKNGKAKYDISVAPWVDAEELHAQVTVNEGYGAYDENDNIYPTNDKLSLPGFYFIYETYVNHREVKSVTFIIKKNPTPIEAGYQVTDSFSGGEPKTYNALSVRASKVILDANTNGAEFDLSLKVNSNAPVKDTLSSSNPSVFVDLGSSSTLGNNISFTLTPKSKANANITFTLCPVVNLNDTILVDTATDVYKTYINLPDENAELKFTNANPDATVLGGFPITVTLGDSTVTWDSASDLKNISTTKTGNVPLSFTFGEPDEANLYLVVEDINASTDVESDIVLGESISVHAANMFDGLVLKFIPEESGTYLITITGDKAATVNVEDNSSAETFFASDYDDGVITLELEANIVYILTFSTDEVDDEYTAVVTKSEPVPDNPEDADITLGESFTVTLAGALDMSKLSFYADETGTYLVTIDSENIGVNWLTPVSTDGGKYVYEIEVSAANKLVTLIFTTTAGGTGNVVVTKKAA